MQKIKVYYRNGAIMISSPMNKWEAQSFRQKFDGDTDVINTEIVMVDKLQAQLEFRQAAADWCALGERESANKELRTLAVRHFVSHTRVGTSG